LPWQGDPKQLSSGSSEVSGTGFACWPFFLKDPCLENLRVRPEFELLVSSLQARYPPTSDCSSLAPNWAAFYTVGGLLVVGAYYVAVIYAERFPPSTGAIGLGALPCINDQSRQRQ
jgi:hypothetical protein